MAYYRIDLSIEMLQQARKNLGRFPYIQLINSSVDKLSEGTNFGAATLLLVLHFLEDDGSKFKLLKEIGNRMKSDAPFVLLDITGDKQQLKENLEILRKLISASVDKEQVDMRINRISNELHSVSEKRLSDLLIKAGFKKPIRFYQSAVYMGWITRKKIKDYFFRYFYRFNVKFFLNIFSCWLPSGRVWVYSILNQ